MGVSARGQQIEPTEPQLAVAALGGICEMMLKTAEQLANWERRESGYPVDSFFDVLRETAVAAACTYTLNWSLERAVAFRPH